VNYDMIYLLTAVG